jgi:predicted  nucleic acid-binding Zn-ribbon protein
MSEDLIAQACAKIERLQASNDEYRKQMETLTAQMNEQLELIAEAQTEVKRLTDTGRGLTVHISDLNDRLATRETALTEARGHVSELREGFCVYACPDEGHLPTCINASRWLSGK